MRNIKKVLCVVLTIVMVITSLTMTSFATETEFGVNTDWAGKGFSDEINVGSKDYAYGISAFSQMADAMAIVNANMLPLTINIYGDGNVGQTETEAGEGIKITIPGTYSIKGNEWANLGYLQLNPDKALSGTRYVFNVSDSKFVMTKPQLRGLSDFNITNSHVDFTNQLNALCGYLFAFRDSVVTIKDSVVGFDKAQGNSSSVVAGEESTTGTNSMMKAYIYGKFNANNSTIFAFGGDTKDNAFSIYDRGQATFTDSVLYANQITIGNYENRADRDTVGNDSGKAVLTLNNSKIIDNQGEVHGLIVGSTKTGSLVLTNGSTVNYSDSTVDVNNNGTITLDASSSIKAKTFTNNGGTVEIDMSNATENKVVLIDAGTDSIYGTLDTNYKFVEGKDGDYTLSVENGDLVATKSATTNDKSQNSDNVKEKVKNKSSKSTKSAKTADNSNIVFWSIIMMSSLAAMSMVLVRRKENNN